MNFSDWSEALPFGLRVGRAFARRQPYQLDVDSVVMAALWQAQTRGAVFSKAYVALRVRGALQDEMRTLAEGQRGNYQGVNLFVDVHEHGRWLADEEIDIDERIDRQRLLESMPNAARELVTRLASGEQQQEIAAALGVSAPRVQRVTSLLKTNPQSVRRLPGQVALFDEIRRAHRSMVQRAYARTGSVRGVALQLGVSMSDASRWVNSRKLILPSKFRAFPELREKAQKLIRAAFVRANGSPASAARLLMTECSVSSYLGREFAPDLVRSNRRPDITTKTLAGLLCKGWSQERIAAHLDVGETTIARRVRRGSLGTLLRTRPDLPDSAFAELRGQGLRHSEIAVRLGVSEPTVFQRLRRAKGLAKC